MACSQGEGNEMRVGPVVFRFMEFHDAGHVVDRHTHDFDHATIGVQGRVRVNLYRDGALCESAVLGPRDAMNVPAWAEHEIVGIDPDSEAWCVFVNHGTERDAV